MPEDLGALLDNRDCLLIEGDLRPALRPAGLRATDPAELWNIDQPDKILAAHQDSITAGADILLSNTIGANAVRLRIHKAEAQLAAINQAGAELAHQAAAEATRPILAAGRIGPTGEVMEPMGTMTEARAEQIYLEQATALQSGGIRLLWAEGLTALEEVGAVASAAHALGLGWVVTMRFDAAGHSMMGISPAQFATFADGLSNPPLAIGSDCSGGPDSSLLVLKALIASGIERPLIVRSGQDSAGATPLATSGAGVRNMAEFATLARDMGARVIGACPNAGAAHLTAMRQALDATPRGPRPTAEMIAARLSENLEAGLDGPV